MSDSDSDQDNFLLAGEGPTKVVSMTAAKKAMLKDIADEFGNKDLADLPFLHGVEPLTGGRLNLKRVFTDQFKLLIAEKDEEEKQKKVQQMQQQQKTSSTAASNSATIVLPARRKREGEEDEKQEGKQNFPLTFLELCQATSYGPKIILSDKRMNLVRWKNNERNEVEGNTNSSNETTRIVVMDPVSIKTTRICSCCARLARFRCPVCYNYTKNNSNASTTGTTIFSDPDGGLVCGQACLELHAATRCGKHVQ